MRARPAIDLMGLGLPPDLARLLRLALDDAPPPPEMGAALALHGLGPELSRRQVLILRTISDVCIVQSSAHTHQIYHHVVGAARYPALAPADRWIQPCDPAYWPSRPAEFRADLLALEAAGFVRRSGGWRLTAIGEERAAASP